MFNFFQGELDAESQKKLIQILETEGVRKWIEALSKINFTSHAFTTGRKPESLLPIVSPITGGTL